MKSANSKDSLIQYTLTGSMKRNTNYSRLYVGELKAESIYLNLRKL